jgi:uncharacterized protein
MMWLAAIGALAALYAGAVAYMYLGQRAFLYHPSAKPADATALGAAGYSPFSVRGTDDLTLTAWRRDGDGDKPTIVLFHGNAGDAGDRIDIANQAARHGYTIVLAGYRGFGGNPGAPTEEGLYADARATLDALGGGPFVIWGESLGTGVATKLANERPTLGVILQSPYISVADRAAEMFAWLPARRLVIDRFDSASRIATIGAPLLVVHGSRDTLIPIAHGRAIFDAANPPKTFVELTERGHGDMAGPEFEAGLVAFLRSLALSRPAP